jgi:hypothetical protein
MRRVILVGLFALTAAVSAAHAQETKGDTKGEIRSARAMLPYCMAALKPGAQDLASGRCLGILATLSFVSRVLPDNLKFCQPGAATPEIMLQAVESFMTANPDAVEQDFRLIALAAMRSKWPCQEGQE